MKKIVYFVLTITLVLGLNAIATAIEFPGINEPQNLGEPKTVAELEVEDHLKRRVGGYRLQRETMGNRSA